MNAWAVVKNGKVIKFKVTDVLPMTAPAIYSTRAAARHFCTVGAGEVVVPCRITIPAIIR